MQRASVASVLALAIAGCLAEGRACEPDHEAASAGCAERDFFFVRETLAAEDWEQSTAWQNLRGGTVVEWRGALEEGAFDVTIDDAEGTRVFHHTFLPTESASFDLSAAEGERGKWRVNLTATDATGVIDVVLRAKGIPIPE